MSISTLAENNNGWLFTIASSVSCFLGSLIIYTDILLKPFPSSIQIHNLSDNRKFLIISLSLSSGILIFTALYSLLPKAFKKASLIDGFKGIKISAGLTVISLYISGVLLCAFLNFIIHRFTSKSIIHCAHSNTKHNHQNDYEHGLENERQQEHEHEHEHERHSKHCYKNNYKNDLNKYNKQYNKTSKQPLLQHELNNNYNTFINNEFSKINSERLKKSKHSNKKDNTFPGASDARGRERQNENIFNNHNTYASNKTYSILDFAKLHLRECKCDGECYGYSSLKSCKLMNGKNESFSYLNLEDELGPELLNLNAKFHTYPCHDIEQGGGIADNETVVADDDNDSEGGSSNKDINNHCKNSCTRTHHHHINTGRSEIFTIAVETSLAIALHKIPEGIITYFASAVDTQTGFSVFLALAIHNFSEGFTIAFPIFVATKKRWLATLSAFILGGLTQPLGAFLAWLCLHLSKSKNDGKDISESDFALLYTLLFAITSGFISLIGFQMFSTALEIGGVPVSTVIFWMFTGISIIGFSYGITG